MSIESPISGDSSIYTRELKNFLVSMSHFPERYEGIATLRQDHELSASYGVQFIGKLQEIPLPCVIGLYEQDPGSPLQYFVRSSVLLQLDMPSVNWDEIKRMNYRMHRDIPETRAFPLYVLQGETGYHMSIMSMFMLTDRVDAEGIEKDFHRLCRSSIRIMRQFLIPGSDYHDLKKRLL